MFKLLDLFCGAGGCTRGYQCAGFQVRGIDSRLQKRYVGEEFVQADALEYLSGLIESREIREFDVIHASPPCQAYSKMKGLTTKQHPELVDAVRKLLWQSSLPYVIENVAGSPLYCPLVLCGTMFGLNTLRHRYFETNPMIFFPPFTCNHHKPVVKANRAGDWKKEFICIVGHFTDAGEGRKVMGIDWMTRDELSQAIPPAYTEYVGKQLIGILNNRLCQPESCDTNSRVSPCPGLAS